MKYNPCLVCNICHFSECDYWKAKDLVKDLVSAIENGVEDQV